MRDRLSMWLQLALVAVAMPGCLALAGRHWDRTRQTVIEPINSVLHKQLPHAIAARDLDAILAVYATNAGTGIPWTDPARAGQTSTNETFVWNGPAARESLRDRYAGILGLFLSVDKAEIRIHRIHWDEHTGDGYPADIRLLVRGTGSDGTTRMLDQRARVTIDRRDGLWRLTAERITDRVLLTAKRPRFEPATAQARIDDTHETTGSPPFRLIGDTYAPSGSAVGDFDCDGSEDIAVASASRLALYRNNGDGTFANVTAHTGLPAALDLAGTGLVFFDADNDGDPDLWLCGIRAERFFRNDGCGRFVDATAAVGIAPSQWSTMPLVSDYDRDGHLDVYVVRMGNHESTAPRPSWEARNGVRDTLYHNRGDGTFEDVTDAAGIRGTTWGFAAAWGDYDNDRDPDLYVGNEFGLNSLYRNNGDGTFTDVADQAGARDRGSAMGVAWSDFNNDGHLDLYVANMYPNSRWALFHPDFPPPVPWFLRWLPRSEIHKVLEELTRGNTLLQNNGDGTFTDVTDDAGVRDCQWGWAANFLDYDNDGRLDIYATNGYVSGPVMDDI
jgi:hypothetical protein